MPVTFSYQVFPQATYDWGSLTATNAPLQINAALETWVAACNANAGNTLKQLTIHKKPTDGNNNSTMPNGDNTYTFLSARRGWVIQANNSATKGLIFYFAGVKSTSTSTDNYEFYVTEISNWTNSSNHTNGYGLFVNPVTAISYAFTGNNEFNYTNRTTGSQFLVAYSSDPNQEFFCLGFNNPSNSFLRATWIIYKDNLNNWGASLINRNGTTYGAFSLENTLYTTSHWLFNSSTSNSRLNSVIITTNATLAGISNGQNSPSLVRRIAHPNVLSTDGSTTRFSFGSELVTNSRRFYGMSDYYLVIER